MNKYEIDDMEAFLWEVETTSQKVRDIIDGKIDLRKIDEKEKARDEKKAKEEIFRKMKDEENERKLLEQLRQGVQGKGEKDNYKKFCMRCFIEYEIEDLVKCSRCCGDLITKEQRHKDLKFKVEQLKEKKAKKMVRKNKYENWMKTEGIFKTTKASFKNYQKWDLYESSTDEDEKGEPILPRNDPNFLALEKDLIETEKKRELSRKKSILLKDEGNKMMQAERYKKAIKIYTEAIDENKSMMILYTNRALAYIKVEEYENAIVDCEKVIDYLEVFEDQLAKHKDTYLKALTRKAICCAKMKNYTEAKEQLVKAKEVMNSEEIQRMETNLGIEEEIHIKGLSVIQGKETEFCILNTFIENIEKENEISMSTHINCCKLLEIDNNRLYFIQKNGLDLVFRRLKKYPQLIGIIDSFNKDNKFVVALNNIKGYNRLINIISDQDAVFDINFTKSLMSIMEDASLNEEVRKSLSSVKNVNNLFKAVFTKYNINSEDISTNKDVVLILMSFFAFVCNMCYSAPQMRTKLAIFQEDIIKKVNLFLSRFEIKNTLIVSLTESILSFLTNLSCDLGFRKYIANSTELITTIISKILTPIPDLFPNFQQYDDIYEKTLSLLFNLSTDTDLTTLFIECNLPEVFTKFVDYFSQNKYSNCSLESINKTLMIVGKIGKENSKVFIQENSLFFLTLQKLFDVERSNLKTTEQLIKIFAYLTSEKNRHLVDSHVFNLENLLKVIKSLFSEFQKNTDLNRERIINILSLMINILNIDVSQSVLLKDIIDPLISIAKDKLDLLRKNSAILIAKIAKSSDEMNKYVRELHGMDVLINVSKFINMN